MTRISQAQYNSRSQSSRENSMVSNRLDIAFAAFASRFSLHSPKTWESHKTAVGMYPTGSIPLQKSSWLAGRRMGCLVDS